MSRNSEEELGMTTVESIRRIRRPALTIWIVLWLLLAAMLLFPVRFGLLRMAMVGTTAGIGIGTLLLFGNRRGVQALALLAAGCLAFLLLAPGSPGDPARLRLAYVDALSRYEGARYVWGGVTRRGIDCSGLVRSGLIDALVREGWRTANPRLLREAAALWWHDSSARALKDGHRDQARQIVTTPSLNELDASRLRPGDFAITEDGVHALAYLGESVWIEADPTVMRVIRVKAPSPENAWFDRPVHIMRWKRLKT